MPEFNAPLIDVTQLQALLQGAAPPVVADCRFALGDSAAGEAAYRVAHIPSAAYLHLERELSGPRGAVGGRHPLPSAAAFAAVMRRIGLDAQRLLVAYDDSRGAYASRLWWLARYFGHDRVCVLDGGIDAWNRAGLASTAVVTVPPTGNFTACPRPQMCIDYEQLVARAGADGLSLIDSREPRRYTGLEEPIDPVAGHVPGALNRPWTAAAREDGTFADPATQSARWRDLAGTELVVYCGSGVTACVNLLSLELAGVHGARLYPGSWSDWCSRPGAAVETGG